MAAASITDGVPSPKILRRDQVAARPDAAVYHHQAKVRSISITMKMIASRARRRYRRRRAKSLASTAIMTEYDSTSTNNSSLRERKSMEVCVRLSKPPIRKTNTYRFVALKRARRKTRRSVVRVNSTSSL